VAAGLGKRKAYRGEHVCTISDGAAAMPGSPLGRRYTKVVLTPSRPVSQIASTWTISSYGNPISE
jgi:hypothetical protein